MSSDAAESQLGGTGLSTYVEEVSFLRVRRVGWGNSISLDAAISLTDNIRLIELREAERVRAGSAD